jgi:hypothetical protein
MFRSRVTPLLAVVALALPALGSAAATHTSAAVGIDPANFVAKVTNPWFPLRPGTTYVYLGTESGRPSRDVMSVTAQTKTILGVRCVVVHDNVYISGRLAERTSDWYAQDKRGTVWYFGEATAELDSAGNVTTTEGSWEGGADGALPGVIMPGRPKVGQSFRQEYYKGHAEDHFAIESLSTSVRVPYVSSGRAMRTREWTPLEPGSVEHKYYARGVGMIKDGSAELVSLKRP